MVEFIRQPETVLLKDNTPEYGWLVPKEAGSQSAYQLLVASSKANIDNNIGDIWNSGQVRKNTVSNITHKGEPLKTGIKYYWKVRIWDDVNRTGDYSESQSFQVGGTGGGISTPNIFQIERIKPKVFIKKTNAYFVDFGKDAFANLELNYTTTKKDSLTIRLGEQLENGQINKKTNRKYPLSRNKGRG